MKARAFLLAFAAGIALPAGAQNAAQSAITLYGGYRGGGSFEQTATGNPANLSSSAAGAVSVDWPMDAARKVQLFASGQHTTLQLSPGTPSSVPVNVGYLHLGGSNFFEGIVGEGAYIAGGLGATFMSPQYSGLTSEVRPSMSIAFGYEHPLGNSVALRMEVRGYATLINSSGGFFCSGGCVIAIRGDALLQADALLGLSYRF
jgi:hypothetical protein